MPTLLKLGPADKGRPLSLEEYTTATFEEGYKYELIDGRLTVAPAADLGHHRKERWLEVRLTFYALEHPEVINFVADKARVFVPGRPEVTVPEPDVAAYRDFPHDAGMEAVNWQDISPVLIVEVISPDDPNKDLVRNADLY